MSFTSLQMCPFSFLLWIIAWFVFLLQRPLLSMRSSFSSQCLFSVLYDDFLLRFSHCSRILQHDHLYYVVSHFTVFCFALLGFKIACHCPTRRESFFFFLFVPKLGSCRVSFCILFSLYCIAEHRVGVSYTPQALLLLCRDLFT